MKINSFFSAADIQIPEDVLSEICVLLNEKKENIYLIPEKSIFDETRKFYSLLKTHLHDNSVVDKTTKKYKIFKYVNTIKLAWAKTVSAQRCVVIWIPKQKLSYFKTLFEKIGKKSF